eukprot:6754217-Karenia_brevis.AAC.1
MNSGKLLEEKERRKELRAAAQLVVSRSCLTLQGRGKWRQQVQAPSLATRKLEEYLDHTEVKEQSGSQSHA